MPNPEDIREGQRAAWAELSAGWEKWDAVIQQQLRPVGAAMVERLAIRANQQHLDIASGTGEPGLTVASMAPRGSVVLTDLSVEMLDVAERRAATLWLTNVDAVVCSAEDLPFDDATFDSISVRFGYMFFPDMVGATEEFVRVLAPGGRLCASVWIEPDRNPWTTIAVQAIATETTSAAPDPDSPHMFRCAAPGQVGELFERAGLCEVEEWEVAVELVTPSPEAYWDVISEHVSLAVVALQRVDESARARIRAHAIEQVRAFQTGDDVRVPGLARCIVGATTDPARLARR